VTAAAAFENIEKTYPTGLFGRGGVPAVRGVSLTVPGGTVFGLLGPNRAGKTTLVKLLLSLARPTKGTVARLGAPARDRRTLARVGYMHENHAFPRYLSAAEVLRFYGVLSGADPETLPKRTATLLERVGLADRAHEPIGRFSKGMIQRLGLAQAVVNDPDLLVLDEPTEGLDLSGRQLLREVVRDHKRAGKTVLLVIVSGKLAYRGNLTELLVGPNGGRRPLEHALRTVYDKGAAG
jgi:ABC-2 type transport system ATP-binding protein